MWVRYKCLSNNFAGCQIGAFCNAQTWRVTEQNTSENFFRQRYNTQTGGCWWSVRAVKRRSISTYLVCARYKARVAYPQRRTPTAPLTTSFRRRTFLAQFDAKLRDFRRVFGVTPTSGFLRTGLRSVVGVGAGAADCEGVRRQEGKSIVEASPVVGAKIRPRPFLEHHFTGCQW